MTTTTVPTPQTEEERKQAYEQYQSRQNELNEIETARVRLWGYALGAYLTGPIWTGYIAHRTKVWAPFWVGLGVGVISLPFAALDLGIISSLPATGIATVMMKNKTEEKRRKLNIHTAEQADMIKFTKGF